MSIEEELELSAHRKLFPEAFEAMLKEMDRHQPEYGDRWLEDDINVLLHCLRHAVNDYMIGSTHALDVANLAVMIHLKQREFEEPNFTLRDKM